MGRIKGSKNKPKISVELPMGITKEDWKGAVDQLHPGDFKSESIPYPSNWDSLGKVAKLQFLTEHRKK